ncbi:MAG: efflux RND transporter periplasmic adaptor subunit [Terracidiphilus sp.]|nr:efflux RND transporter periplasmic adaptor subunit [Terracidiphilus sp.]
MSIPSDQHPQSSPAQEAHPAPDSASSSTEQSLSPRLVLAGGGLLIALLVVLAILGIFRRVHEQTVLAGRTRELAAPAVAVAPPSPGAPVNSFILPGNVTSFTDSPIYARTSGYLTRWYFDIGARVKKGALLAEISAPEVDQQLAQARADLASAEANANNARLQSDRYSGLVKSNAVSRQDTDAYLNQATATAAAVRSAQANVNRLRQLQSYEKVYAPFDGVVTARTVDTGQLIDSGAARELFHLQAIQTLRVYTNIPQIYSSAVTKGSKIDITFPEHTGKTYQGTLVRTADAIDPTSRTLLVEIDIDNKTGELLPGSLAQVHFKLPQTASVLVVPSAALIFRKEGMMLGTVVGGNRTHLAPVVIGQDDGATVQIVAGIGSSDQIIQDPPDSLIEGQAVLITHPSGNPAAESK